MRRQRRDAFEARMDKRDAVQRAEAAGQVADSMAVRLDLIRRLEAGELTPDQMQGELRRIKREARKNGLTTLDEVYRNG